jgi:hypothetical protein
MFWHLPCYVGKATPPSAIREGDFKLIEFFENGGGVELCNLRTDPGEEHDLATRTTEKIETLYRSLKQWQRDAQAALPRGDNPEFDPKAERPRGRQSGRPSSRTIGMGFQWECRTDLRPSRRCRMSDGPKPRSDPRT